MVVEFESGAYEVDEDAGVVTLTLVKRTPTTQSVTVLLSTVDGSAVGGIASTNNNSFFPRLPQCMKLSQVATLFHECKGY